MSQLDVLTYHNDIGRTGVYSQETTLTPSNVNSNTFGFLFSDPVDGAIYGEPLYMSQITIQHQGVHNVVFVVTENNSVYAFDADAAGPPLWHVNLAPSVPNVDTAGTGINPVVGITGTPVIARRNPNISGTTPTIYMVTFTGAKGSNGKWTFEHQLHALDALNGQ